MKKYILSLVLLITSMYNLEAQKPEHLAQIERATKVYIYEVTKVEWDTLVDVYEEPFLVYKKNEALDRAYNNVLEALNRSLGFIYRGEAENAKIWIDNCPIFRYAVNYLGLDVMCDQKFGPCFSREEYVDFFDYFYNHL